MTSHLSGIGQTLLVDVARLFLWLVLLTLVFLPLERFFFLTSSHRKRGDLLVDLAFFFLNGLAPALLIAAPLSLVVAILNLVTPPAYLEMVGSSPLWARLAAGLVVSEIGAYWAHRLCHENPWLWRFHALHHAPQELSWLVNTRAHPVDVVFTRLGGLVPLYVFGLAGLQATAQDAMVPVYVTLIGTVWAFFIHANVRWRFGPLEALVSTPAFHHWHHTNDEHRDHNYAALFPWVDRLFRTHHLPRTWPSCYGVDETPSGSIADQLLHPFTPARRLPPTCPQSPPAQPGVVAPP